MRKLFIFIFILSLFSTVNAKTLLIYGPIAPETYTKFYQLTKNLGDKEPLILLINSPGGHTYTQRKIITHIEKLKKNRMVICQVDKEASSAAAYILMNCSQILVSKNATILFHVARVGSLNGKMYVTSSTYYPEHYYSTLYDLERFVKPLLTEREWKVIVDGQDLVFDGKEFNKRLSKLNRK